MSLPSPSRGTRVIGSPILRPAGTSPRPSAWVKHGLSEQARAAWEPLGVHASNARGWIELGFTPETIPPDWAKRSCPQAWEFTGEAMLPREVAWGALWDVASTRFTQWAYALGQSPQGALRLAWHARRRAGVSGLQDGGPVFVDSPADGWMMRTARQVRALDWDETIDAVEGGTSWARLRYRNWRALAATTTPLPRPLSRTAVRRRIEDYTADATEVPLPAGSAEPAMVVSAEFAAVGAALGRTPVEVGTLAYALVRRFRDPGKVRGHVSVNRARLWPMWSSGYSYTMTRFAAACADVSWADVATCLEAGMSREEALAHTSAGLDMEPVRLMAALVD